MTKSQKKEENIRILEIDPWLKPFDKDIRLRIDRYQTIKETLLGSHPDLKSFANGHLFFGFHRADEGWYYREWAPAADTLHLMGDFNNWDPESHPLRKLSHGCWEVFIPGRDSLMHLSRVKVRVRTGHRVQDRIPLYIRRIVQDPGNHTFCGQIWQPENPFSWTDNGYSVDRNVPLFIYESHVGMAQEKEGMGTYKEFKDNILPRVKAGGYNTIQLMAIMEHPYYASFGYQVSNFFAVSAWFGTPDELKDLINTAHSIGINVLLDLVHSHAVKNLGEGINEFDGTDYQFFHAGGKGNHPAWDSKVFDYGKPEVVHFLLSNIKFWLEEYHFDGFRFDGVTSMLYHHHGLGVAYTEYKKYFGMDTDLEAVTFLQFANDLIKEVRPDAVTIAEDMSGMPGMAYPVKDGGIGFDYRLAMGVPDYWVRTLSKQADENWHIGDMWYQLTTRRPMEKNIGYAESHDQALVGDKTLIFWLADKEMYWHMMKNDPNLAIDRAISLHKMIRFVTLTLAGEGYLNFMGNEFGHPEWIDFPREGNSWSYKYARRQWSLADREDLKYCYLQQFDRDMLAFSREYNILNGSGPYLLWVGEKEKVLAFKKAGLLFLFNFHPSKSHTDFALPTDEKGLYRVIFSSDDNAYGGHERIDKSVVYETRTLPKAEKRTGIIIYSPCRSVMVLEKLQNFSSCS